MDTLNLYDKKKASTRKSEFKSNFIFSHFQCVISLQLVRNVRVSLGCSCEIFSFIFFFYFFIYVYSFCETCWFVMRRGSFKNWMACDAERFFSRLSGLWYGKVLSKNVWFGMRRGFFQDWMVYNAEMFFPRMRIVVVLQTWIKYNYLRCYNDYLEL